MSEEKPARSFVVYKDKKITGIFDNPSDAVNCFLHNEADGMHRVENIEDIKSVFGNILGHPVTEVELVQQFFGSVASYTNDLVQSIKKKADESGIVPKAKQEVDRLGKEINQHAAAITKIATDWWEELQKSFDEKKDEKKDES